MLVLKLLFSRVSSLISPISYISVTFLFLPPTIPQLLRFISLILPSTFSHLPNLSLSLYHSPCNLRFLICSFSHLPARPSAFPPTTPAVLHLSLLLPSVACCVRDNRHNTLYHTSGRKALRQPNPFPAVLQNVLWI
jgi:hypothetical protein